MQKFGSLTLYTNDELIEKAKREQQDRLKNGLRDGDFRIFFRKKDLSIQIDDACDDIFGKGTEALIYSEGKLNWKKPKA